MIYVFENNNNDASVVFDGTTLTEQEIANAIIVEELPFEKVIEGKYANLKCRKSTNEVWYEYEDIALDEDDKITQLENKITELQMAMAELAEMGV